MGSAELAIIMRCAIPLCAFLLIGTFLRAKVKLLQRLFLPACIIGGFAAMLIGPNVWPGGPSTLFPKDWNSVCSALPGVLNPIITASLPITMFAGANVEAKGSSKNFLKVFLIIVVTFFVQILLGLGALGIFKESYGLYDTFGYELMTAYNGGHNTSAVLGQYLHDLGLPYWSTAQGVAMTVATFGLAGGMVIGIAYINIMVRRGKTAVLDKPGNISKEKLRGLYYSREQQTSVCRETTDSATIESLSFHLALLLVCCGISYAIMDFVKARQIPVLINFPVACISIFVMFGMVAVMKKLKIFVLVDPKTASKISGAAVDLAITAALASMPVQVVLKYAVPILVLCGVGFAVTMGVLILLSRFSFTDCVAERVVSMWGSCIGTYTTGITLLRMSDPQFSTSTMRDYSLGFTLSAPVSYLVMPLSIQLVLNRSLGVNFAVQGGLLLLTLAALFIVCGKRGAPGK